MTTIQYFVTSGPSKWDLSLALFDRKPIRDVEFQANCPVGTKMDIEVTSVQAEDTTGESWNVEGILQRAWREVRPSNNDLFFPTQGLRVFIYYRTDRRGGEYPIFYPAQQPLNWGTRGECATSSRSVFKVTRFHVRRTGVQPAQNNPPWDVSAGCFLFKISLNKIGIFRN